jgi:hypothetical protein
VGEQIVPEPIRDLPHYKMAMMQPGRAFGPRPEEVEMKKTSLVIVLALSGAALAGCTTGSRQGDGAVIGGLAGAAIGGAATGTGGGALIGAGVGAVSGAIIADATSGRCYWRDSYGRRHYTSCR